MYQRDTPGSSHRPNLLATHSCDEMVRGCQCSPDWIRKTAQVRNSLINSIGFTTHTVKRPFCGARIGSLTAFSLLGGALVKGSRQNQVLGRQGKVNVFQNTIGRIDLDHLLAPVQAARPVLG